MTASTVIKRVVFGLAMIAAIVGILALDAWLQSDPSLPTVCNYLKGTPTALVLLALAGVGWLELAGLAERFGVKVHRKTGLVGVLLLGGVPMFQEWLLWAPLPVSRLAGPLLAMPVLPALLVLGAFLAQMRNGRLDDPIRRVGVTVLGMLYLGLGAALMLQIRMMHMSLLVLFLTAVKFTDIGGYFIGSAFGKHKMIPWLSPGKSWEGLAGGFVFAAGATVGVRLGLRALTDQPLDIPLWPWALWAVLVGLAGQLGDLCESMIKRAADAKDSGALIPQFGGILDLLDSPLLAAPVAIIVYQWLPMAL